MSTFMSNSAIYCSFYNFSGSLDMLGSFDYRQLQVNEKPKFCILFVLNFCTFPKDAFLIWNIKSHKKSKYVSLLPQLLVLKLARKSKSLTKLSPHSSFLLTRFTSSTLCLIISILSNLKSSRCHTSRAGDGIHSLTCLANHRSRSMLNWPIRALETDESWSIETYLKLPPHPKVSLTGFYSAIVIQSLNFSYLFKVSVWEIEYEPQ